MKKRGKNLEDIQISNRSLVIRMMLRQENLSRVELANKTGLKQATITNIINELLECGLVRETGIIGDSSRGRRMIGLRINTQDFRIICVRLTRKNFVAGVYDLKAEEIYKEKVNIVSQGEVEKTLTIIKNVIRNCMDKSEGKIILGIGAAIPGPFVKAEHHFALVTGFPELKNINLQKILSEEFDVPVYVEHDANAAAFAEWESTHCRNGLIEDEGNLLCVMPGQGVGSGIIIDGKIVRGQLGIAGEIGHMSIDYSGPRCECGNRGCFEKYACISAILEFMKQNIPKYNDTCLHSGSTIQDLNNAFERGDALAVLTITHWAEFLGYGIANLVNILNPDIIVIGDDVPRNKRFLKIVQDTVKERVLEDIYKKLEIRLSLFNDDVTLVGSCYLVVEEVVNSLSFIKIR
ncbi:putative NBD/HSP70 family sugar kinase [Ruminiclostridium sufflavum DSM 19573]|uniref:Putative NBD/HSP70 family sugar kinase n=1 Tax=Ruminiclostridium sufflavum DSM 19573 TaxID=1121337 RepID=A0A318XQL0_9FIRM|nr:ROK family transcriptional regulator [Ruminiclostridium sufflavum]PYG88172.1 putative NBD/HSP70 family sugar kinase [Ruminiclostridium sufflavum DSM 19573]